jgi:plasmid maintenance system killer protein
MTPLRTAFQNETAQNIEYGEAILVALKLKAQRQLDLIAAAQNEEAVALWRSMLDIQAVQEKLSRERWRLSVCR